MMHPAAAAAMYQRASPYPGQQEMVRRGHTHVETADREFKSNAHFFFAVANLCARILRMVSVEGYMYMQ